MRPEPIGRPGWRAVVARAGAELVRLGESGAAWWRGVALPALRRGAGRLAAGGVRLAAAVRTLAPLGARLRRRAAPGLRRAARFLARWWAEARQVPVAPALAALPLAWTGAALGGGLAAVLRAGPGIIAVVLAAWLAGAFLAAGLARVRCSAWFGAGLAGGTALVLGGMAYAGAGRLGPTAAWWVVAAACLVAIGLWGSRIVGEGHLLWAGVLAFLPALGWEGAGGSPAAPAMLGWWAVLGTAGHALAWAAGPPGSLAARVRLVLARLCHAASPFPLLGLIRAQPLGVAFVAGVVAANLCCHGGYVLARPDGFPRGRILAVALALGGVAVAAGVLLDAAGFPR